MNAYIRNQLRLTSTTHVVAFVCYFPLLWLHVSWCVGPLPKPSFNWSQIRRAGAYVKTAVLIIIAYATLLVVNTRYISLVIIPIIVLVFIGALFVMVSLKGCMESDEDNHNEANKADDIVAASKEDGNGGAGDKDNELFLTAVLPGWVLCCMGHFNVDNLVVSQFLLFLTSTLGELTMMMARLPSQVAPAFEVIRRACLVVVLVTAHTMAVELMGDDVMLVCTPELVAVVVWFSIQLGHGGSITVSVIEATSHKSGTVVLGVVAILAYLAASTDESEGEMNLLSKYMSALVACAFSVILPSLCVFALRQWPGKTPLSQTTAARSSELEGAIRLLSFCRDISFKAAAMYLVVTPLVDVRLRLQVQGLAAEILNKLSQ